MTVTTCQIELLSKLLDVASMRHQVIAQNVANVNTPGYHGLDVSFEDAFARQLRSGDERFDAGLKPKDRRSNGRD